MARGGYRPNSGPKKGTKYKQRVSKVASCKETESPNIPHGIVDEAKTENLDPLSYMLKIMNDDTADPTRRDRMAGMAAPYVHPRKSDVGKKEERDAKAKEAGKGRFTPSQPPVLRAVK